MTSSLCAGLPRRARGRTFSAEMIKVLLERAKEGWAILALENGEALEEQSSSDLDEAAATALDMADRHKSGPPELGDGVPPHALQEGEALRVARNAALHGGVS